VKPAAGCHALIEGDCEAGPCDDAAGPIVDQEVRRHADWTAAPARRIQNSEGPLLVESGRFSRIFESLFWPISGSFFAEAICG